MSKTEFLIKRAYTPASASDGYRVLVDRLWPRGMSHATLHYDEWAKDLAPSTELREWFHQDPDGRWDEFADRYKAELKNNDRLAEFVGRMAGQRRVTLLYASHDPLHNNAAVLRSVLEADKEV